MNTLRFLTGSLQPSPGIYNCSQAFAKALLEQSEEPVPAAEGRRMIDKMMPVCRAADESKDALRAVSLRPLPPARVLVTGAGGFLGSRLLARLRERGEPVRILVRRPLSDGTADANLQVICGDLGDPEIVDHAVRGVGIVYHVGAAMKGGQEAFQSGTVVATRNIVKSCLAHKVRRVIYVSSLSVLDHAGHPAGQFVDESATYEPYPERRGLYTGTKLEAERTVVEAAKEHGLPAVIFRPGQIFGPGAEMVAPSGCIGMAGRWIIVGNGKRRLPLVYVDDVVDALLEGERPDLEPGSIFHVVDPEPVDQIEYARRAKASLPGRVKVLTLPLWFMKLASFGVEILGKLLGRDVPLTRYRVASLRPLGPFRADGALARATGWRPRTGTRAGLDATFPPPLAVPPRPAGSAS